VSLRNQPYLPLYVNDFMIDEKLRECSAESTGVYIRLMCLMHKSEKYGMILLDNEDKTYDDNVKNFAKKLKKHMPYDVEIIERSLRELIKKNVVTISEKTLSQKRMIKDNKLSEIRAKAGKKGGIKAKVCNSKNESKIEANEPAKDTANTENEIEYENEYIDTKKKEGAGRKYEKDIGIFFEKLWSLYPRKLGKAQVKEAQRRRLYEIGEEKLTRCIERFIADMKAQRRDDDKYPYGSTFFNGGYIDYLADDYKPQRYKTNYKGTGNDYPQHEYTHEELDKLFDPLTD
jgi:uncharacterized protein YdaU (DUF1376 family)